MTFSPLQRKKLPPRLYLATKEETAISYVVTNKKHASGLCITNSNFPSSLRLRV